MTRRNKIDKGEDDMLLRAPGTWSSKKQQQKLGTPLSEGEQVPKQSPAPSAPPAKNARKKAETVTPMQVVMLAGNEAVEERCRSLEKRNDAPMMVGGDLTNGYEEVLAFMWRASSKIEPRQCLRCSLAKD